MARRPPRDRFTDLEHQLRTQIGTVNERVDRVEARVDALSTEMRQQFERVDQRFEQMGRWLEQQFEQTRRHFDVIAESLMSKIQLVAEGVVAANERMDRFQAALDRLDARVFRLEVRVSALESQRA